MAIDKAKEMSRIKKLKTMDGRHYTPEMAAARKALAKNAPKNYKLNEELVFRGDNINNYLKLSGKLYRIVKLTLI